MITSRQLYHQNDQRCVGCIRTRPPACWESVTLLSECISAPMCWMYEISVSVVDCVENIAQERCHETVGIVYGTLAAFQTSVTKRVSGRFSYM